MENRTTSPEAGERPPESPAQVSAERLLAPGGCVRISYKGQIYTLRGTRNGKLILTK